MRRRNISLIMLIAILLVSLLTSCGDTNKNTENQTETEATETGTLDESETESSQEIENDQGKEEEIDIDYASEIKRMEEVMFFNGPMQIMFYGDNMYSSRYYYEYDETTESDSLFAFYLELTDQYLLRGQEFIEMFLQRDGVFILPEWSDFENDIYCFACTMEDYRLCFDGPEPEFQYIHYQYFAPLSRPDFKEIQNQIKPKTEEESDGYWYEMYSVSYHEVAGAENHLSFVVEVESAGERAIKEIISEGRNYEETLSLLKPLCLDEAWYGNSGTIFDEDYLREDGQERIIKIPYSKQIYYGVYEGEELVYSAILCNEEDNEVLNGEQLKELKELEIKGQGWAGVYWLQMAIITGEIQDFEITMTLDSVRNIIQKENDFEKISEALGDIHPYPDFAGGSGVSITEYWLQAEGREVIRLVHEFETIYHEVYNENGEVISSDILFDGLETGN